MTDPRRFVAVLGLALLCGCAAPVGVERISPQAAQRDLTQSILSSDQISEKARIVLRRMNMEVLWEKDPAEALSQLHTIVARPMNEFDAERRANSMDSLAELSFAYAEESDDSRYYLAAAFYAWRYLFPIDPDAAPPSAVDRGVRLSADIYNRGIALAFMDRESGEVVLEDGIYPLPFGELEVDFDEMGLRVGNRELSRFISVADLRVRGLNNRYRISGLGAPLAARFSEKAVEDDPDPVFSQLRVPVTALLRFDDRPLQPGDRMTAELSVISFNTADATTIQGHSVPLEAEPTAALALQLTETPPWQREIKGFFQGDLALYRSGIVSMAPYQPDRIPLILVHGTASSSGRWADLVNDLMTDPAVRRYYQIWLFSYNTGNPIAYSGWLLKKAIADLVESLDPTGQSATLRDMVILGHSQGGLLAKLQVVDAGEKFWDVTVDERPDEIELKPESRELLEGSLLVRPSPFVKRVIFLSTPHHGSVLANRRLAGLLGRAVRSPANVVNAVGDLFSDDPEVEVQRRLKRSGGSVGNMSPGSNFIKVLAPLPIVPGVSAHSIMGIKREPKEGGTDGVVSYTSAHLDGVDSEKVVLSGHSSQSNPVVISEVRRILIEHLTQAIEAGIVTPD